MEKEKRGAGTRKWEIILLVLTIALIPLCWMFLYYVAPGHSLSDFSRVESAEEVVAFLHEPFDLQVTTSEEILDFMAAYPLSRDRRSSCYRHPIVHETVVEILQCWVPTQIYFLIESGYRIEFWMTKDNLLEYIEADGYCTCS
jgi:hypothetical protein